MPRQARTKGNGRPTVRSLITGLVNEGNRVRQFHDTSTIEMREKTARQIENILGIKFLKEEEISKYPDLKGRQNPEYSAIVKRGEDYLLFSNNAEKGYLGHLRKQGNAFLEDVMMGKYHGNLKKVQHGCDFPDHIRNFLRANGLDPDSVATMLALCWHLDFTHNQTVFKFEARQDAKTRKEIEKTRSFHLYKSPDLKVRQTTLIQISLPGKPKIRLVKKGVSVGTDIPESLAISMIGKEFGNVVHIPGLSTMTIKETHRHSDNIQHFALD